MTLVREHHDWKDAMEVAAEEAASSGGQQQPSPAVAESSREGNEGGSKSPASDPDLVRSL